MKVGTHGVWMKHKILILALVILSLALTACGKKGELEPPEKGDEQAVLLTAKG